MVILLKLFFDVIFVSSNSVRSFRFADHANNVLLGFIRACESACVTCPTNCYGHELGGPSEMDPPHPLDHKSFVALASIATAAQREDMSPPTAPPLTGAKTPDFTATMC